MKLKRFKKSKDFDDMIQWLTTRMSYLPSEAEMPSLGYVVCQDENKVAMGFLRQCEGGYVQLDGYVTNPAIPPETRDKALDLLTDRLIKVAYENGFKQLLCFTLDENTLLRSLRHGFHKLPHTPIVLDLDAANRTPN